MAAAGSVRLEPAAGERTDAVSSHEACNAATACGPAFRAERAPHNGTAKPAALLEAETTNLHDRLAVHDRTSAVRATASCIIATGRDLKYAAHQRDRSLPGVIADESQAHLVTSAKMPIALF